MADIDVSIASLHGAWQAFGCGKRPSIALQTFRAQLEHNLFDLTGELRADTYRHGGYESFVVHDPKRREIAVATVRDRVVHRLLYDYLVPVWDKSFCYDVWSCRKGKGLLMAIERAQHQMSVHCHGWLWRSDITKFFDNVDHDVLRFLLRTKLNGPKALWLLDNVISSYESGQSVSQSVSQSGRGMPIGNLTSQIFANIYLNEFDQFVLHGLKPRAYVRYGDDFVLWCADEMTAKTVQTIGQQFLCDELKLPTNPKHDKVQPATHKLSYLGVDIWPKWSSSAEKNPSTPQQTAQR